MKIAKTLAVILISAFLSTSWLLAQTPILSVTGDTCEGSLLTLHSNIMPTKIVWRLYGVPAFTTSNNWQNSGITVAGNNTSGSDSVSLDHPMDVFIDTVGNLYVADNNNYRVQKWAAGMNYGTTVAGGHGAGSASNQLGSAYGVFVDRNGNIYIADSANHRIQKWAAGASSGTTVAGGNGQGSNANQLNGPTGVFVDVNGNVYVADRGNNRIQKWAVSATSGTTVAGGNGAGIGANQLVNPWGVHVDSAGNMYIADRGNHRIQKWMSAATTATTFAGGNGAGNLPTQLDNPTKVIADRDGDIFIADKGNHRILKWQAGLVSGIAIAGIGNPGFNPFSLNSPTGVHIDINGNVYVADMNNHRVQKYASMIDTTYTAFSAGIYTVAVSTFYTSGTVSPVFNIVPPGTPLVLIDVIQNPICVGAQAVFYASYKEHAGTSQQYIWRVNGIDVQGVTTDTFKISTLNDNDMVSCRMRSNESCLVTDTSASNFIPVTVLPILTPSVSISKNMPDTICAGTAITFIAVDTNAGNNPGYFWQLNGAQLSVPNSDTLIISSLNSGDEIYCKLKSYYQCTTNAFVNSNKDTTDWVIPMVTPAVSLTVSPGDVVCKGDSLIFHAAAMNGGNAAVFEWHKNDTLVGSGADSVYISTNMNNNDSVFCILYSSAACPTANSVASNQVKIYSSPLLVLNASISANPGTTLSSLGQQVTFTVTTVNGGTNLSYQWRMNALDVSGATDSTYVTTTLQNNDVINCVVNVLSNISCINTKQVLSNSLIIKAPLAVSNWGLGVRNLEVYPNPNKGDFIVEGTSDDEELKIEILNMAGQVVYTRTLKPGYGIFRKSLALDKEFANGIYFLRLKGKEVYPVKSLIIER